MRHIPSQRSTKPSNRHLELQKINARLDLELVSSRQVAFDWIINDDRLLFARPVADGLQERLIDNSKFCRTSALPTLIHEGDQKFFRMRLYEALKGRGHAPDIYHQVEVRLRDASRTWRWVSISGKIVERDRKGRALRMVGTFSDIDERKRAEQLATRLRDLYAMLKHANQAISQIRKRELLLEEICRITVEQGRFDGAWINVVNQDSRLALVASHGTLPKQAMTALRDGTSFVDNSPVSAPATEERLRRRPCLASAIQRCRGPATTFNSPSPICVWIKRFGKPFGTLNLHADDPSVFSTQVTGLLNDLARDLSFAIESIERETQSSFTTALRKQSTTMKSATLNAALDCIVLVNQTGEILRFNKAAERTFGLCSDDVLGKELADIIISTDGRERGRQEITSFLTTMGSEAPIQRIEISALRADGTIFPAEITLVPLGGQSKPIFSAFIRDASSEAQSKGANIQQPFGYHPLVESSPEATLVCQHKRIIYANRAACRMIGYTSSKELLGKHLFDLLHPDHGTLESNKNDAAPARTTPTAAVEQVWRRADGSHFNAEVAMTALMHNNAIAYQLVVRDITQRKRDEALQRGQNHVLNMIATGAPISIILTEIARLAESLSHHGHCSILQLQPDGVTLADSVAPSLPPTFLKRLGTVQVKADSGCCGTAAFLKEPVVVTDIATSSLWREKGVVALSHGLNACASWPIFGKQQKLLGTVALYYPDAFCPSQVDSELFSVCTELAGIAIESRASEERMRHLAHYDGLTSLPNRFLFKEYLDMALRNARRRMKKFAVLFVDLDKFKEINDTLGHDAGDLVLREMASRLRACLRHSDKIARMGGDEFYVLIEDLENGSDAAEVAQKLLEEAVRPIRVGNKECQLSASVGIAIFPDDGSDGVTLLSNADKAMYRAKEQGKNAFQFFSPHKAPGSPELVLVHPRRCEMTGRVRFA